MTEPPPRNRFQIHLSTAIVMMFVAGGLIWANVHSLSMIVSFVSIVTDSDSGTACEVQWGFPITALSVPAVFDEVPPQRQAEFKHVLEALKKYDQGAWIEDLGSGRLLRYVKNEKQLRIGGFGIDVFFALGLLATV